MGKAPNGTCRICGTATQLTFEHIPPKSALNNHPLVDKEIRRLINCGDYESVGGRTLQRGGGGYYTCSICNNSAGRWYVKEYGRWVAQAMELLGGLTAPPVLAYRYSICPLNCFKQVVYMLVALNSPELAEGFPVLRSYLLNRKSRQWDPRFRLYMNYNVSPHSRFAGAQGILNGIESPTTHVVSELGFPPFTFLMTHDCEPPSDKLVDITFFNDSLYDEVRDVWLALPLVKPYTFYPADYRSREEVLNKGDENASK